jgi:hypothetical protein
VVTPTTVDPLEMVGTDGEVRVSALSPDGKTLYIGGDFTRVGQATGSFVPVDADTGSITARPNVNGGVTAQVPDGLGGWYIGGTFTTIGGKPRYSIAHLLSDGTLDTNFVDAKNSEVSAIAFKGHDLFIAECAVDAQQQDVSCFVADIDAATGSQQRWKIPIEGDVRQMAISGSSLYLAGTISTVAGVSRSQLAALDTTSGALLAWAPNPATPGYVSHVNAIAAAGDTIFVGGDFETIGGANRAAIAALDATSGAALNWDAKLGASSQVQALTVDGSVLYVGGSFSGAGGQPRAGVAALDVATGVALTWDAGLNGINGDEPPLVNVIAVNQSRVFVGGTFQLPGGSGATSLAALDKGSGAAQAWLDADQQRLAITQLSAAGSQVAVAGNFALIGGAARNHIAAIDLTTGLVSDWNPGSSDLRDQVSDLLATGSTIYVAGQFAHIGGADRTGLAAIDAETGGALPWNPQLEGSVNRLTASSTTLYVGGGNLTSVNGQPRTQLAAFDLSTGQLTSWAPRTDYPVARLIATDATVYLGGPFTSVNGETHRGVAAVDPNLGELLAWNPDVYTPFLGFGVSDMALANGSLYLVGKFEQVSGQARGGIAAVEAATGTLLPWNPSGALFLNPTFVEVSGDRVYVGTGAGSLKPPTPAVVALGTSTGDVLATNFVVQGHVDALAVAGNRLYLAGQFTDSNTGLAPNLANFAE